MKRPLLVVCLILLCLALAGCLPGSADQVSVTRPAVTETIAATTVPILPTTEEPTPEPSPLPLPSPTAVPTEAPELPAPPVRENVDNLTAVSANAIAYVQNDQLFIRTLPGGEMVPVQTETCAEGRYCTITYQKWSPDGQFLLYYYYDGQDDSLRLSDRQGNIQTIDDVAFFQPGAWSPDGRTLVYMNFTGTSIEPTETQPGGRVFAIWTVSIEEDGIMGTPQMVGTWQELSGGCGGGGRSASEVLYEKEGGTAYGYQMGVTEWTRQNILLYTNNCTNIGIGRFDMTTGTELPGFDQPMRNLMLNASGDRWYAVTGYDWSSEPGNNELVTGTPDSTEITLIPTSARIELVFTGKVSGALYYTERTALGRDETGAYFESALWRIQPDGSGEERLWFGEDDHAYAQVSETAVGDLLFVLVENERPLAAAAQFTEGNPETLQAYTPQRHIMQLPASGDDPVMILSNAGQPALTLQ